VTSLASVVLPTCRGPNSPTTGFRPSAFRSRFAHSLQFHP
jgi:hypothetical protein